MLCSTSRYSAVDETAVMGASYPGSKSLGTIEATVMGAACVLYCCVVCVYVYMCVCVCKIHCEGGQVSCQPSKECTNVYYNAYSICVCMCMCVVRVMVNLNLILNVRVSSLYAPHVHVGLFTLCACVSSCNGYFQGRPFLPHCAERV